MLCRKSWCQLRAYRTEFRPVCYCKPRELSISNVPPHPPAVPLRIVGGVSVQDPFSEGSDPAFHNKQGPGPGGAPYQQGGGPTDPSMRIQYDANKDLYGARKGPCSELDFVGGGWVSLQSVKYPCWLMTLKTDRLKSTVLVLCKNIEMFI